MARHKSARHARVVWEMRHWLFSIWKENICLCTQLTADRLAAGNSNSSYSLYRIDSGHGNAAAGGGWHPVTRQTSDGSGINGEY